MTNRNGPRVTPKPEPEEPKRHFVDDVLEMRLRRLVAAGLQPDQAIPLAKDKHIDLHKAESLVRSAGPELALEILL